MRSQRQPRKGQQQGQRYSRKPHDQRIAQKPQYFKTEDWRPKTEDPEGTPQSSAPGVVLSSSSSFFVLDQGTSKRRNGSSTNLDDEAEDDGRSGTRPAFFVLDPKSKSKCKCKTGDWRGAPQSPLSSLYLRREIGTIPGTNDML